MKCLLVPLSFNSIDGLGPSLRPWFGLSSGLMVRGHEKRCGITVKTNSPFLLLYLNDRK